MRDAIKILKINCHVHSKVNKELHNPKKPPQTSISLLAQKATTVCAKDVLHGQHLRWKHLGLCVVKVNPMTSENHQEVLTPLPPDAPHHAFPDARLPGCSHSTILVLQGLQL